MTVAIIAKYPWKDIETISAGESERLFILTDSRVGTENQLFNQYRPFNQYQTLKQEVFSSNLVVCYSSSHLFALKQALKEKLGDPTTAGPNSRLATNRDIKRLGRMIREQHSNSSLRGYSDVLVAIWPKRSPSPRIYQLMAPDYKAKECNGIVGVGDTAVLTRFQELLPRQLKSQRLTPDDPQFDPRWIESLRRQFGSGDKPIVWNQARMAVHVAFTEAILHSESQKVDIPITSTLLDKNGVDLRLSSAVLKPNNKIVQITKFSKPSFYGKRFIGALYKGKARHTRSALQLFD